MDFRTDLEAVGEGVICLLALSLRDGDQSCALASRHRFESEDPAAEAVVAWRDTSTGERLPAFATPYAYWVVTLPDPAVGDDSYG